MREEKFTRLDDIPIIHDRSPSNKSKRLIVSNGGCVSFATAVTPKPPHTSADTKTRGILRRKMAPSRRKSACILEDRNTVRLIPSRHDIAMAVQVEPALTALTTDQCSKRSFTMRRQAQHEGNADFEDDLVSLADLDTRAQTQEPVEFSTNGSSSHVLLPFADSSPTTATTRHSHSNNTAYASYTGKIMIKSTNNEADDQSPTSVTFSPTRKGTLSTSSNNRLYDDLEDAPPPTTLVWNKYQRSVLSPSQQHVGQLRGSSASARLKELRAAARQNHSQKFTAHHVTPPPAVPTVPVNIGNNSNIHVLSDISTEEPALFSSISPISSPNRSNSPPNAHLPTTITTSVVQRNVPRTPSTSPLPTPPPLLQSESAIKNERQERGRSWVYKHAAHAHQQHQLNSLPTQNASPVPSSLSTTPSPPDSPELCNVNLTPTRDLHNLPEKTQETTNVTVSYIQPQPPPVLNARPPSRRVFSVDISPPIVADDKSSSTSPSGEVVTTVDTPTPTMPKPTTGKDGPTGNSRSKLHQLLAEQQSVPVPSSMVTEVCLPLNSYPPPLTTSTDKPHTYRTTLPSSPADNLLPPTKYTTTITNNSNNNNHPKAYGDNNITSLNKLRGSDKFNIHYPTELTLQLSELKGSLQRFFNNVNQTDVVHLLQLDLTNRHALEAFTLMSNVICALMSWHPSKSEPHWIHFKGLLQRNSQGVLKQMQNTDLINDIKHSTVTKLRVSVLQTTFNINHMASISPMLGSLCKWVLLVLKVTCLKYGWDIEHPALADEQWFN